MSLRPPIINLKNTGNSRYIHWSGVGYIETVDIRKYVASSKENGNLYFLGKLYFTYEKHRPQTIQ